MASPEASLVFQGEQLGFLLDSGIENTIFTEMALIPIQTAAITQPTMGICRPAGPATQLPAPSC